MHPPLRSAPTYPCKCSVGSMLCMCACRDAGYVQPCECHSGMTHRTAHPARACRCALHARMGHRWRVLPRHAVLHCMRSVAERSATAACTCRRRRLHRLTSFFIHAHGPLHACCVSYIMHACKHDLMDGLHHPWPPLVRY